MKPLASLVVALAALLSACETCDETPGLELIDLGVEVELHAVTKIGYYDGTRIYQFLAVGESGTVVTWGVDHSRKPLEVYVEVFEVGDADLHAVWVADSSYDSTAWWVVGDAGTVATSDNLGQTWNLITLPSGGADLYGITEFEGRVVIVGDELVLVRDFDRTWGDVAAPVGQWGSLRAVASRYRRLYAVGLGGTVWSTDAPAGAWFAEDAGVDVDLFDVGQLAGDPETMVAVGAEGTVLLGGLGSWTRLDTGVDVDFVDFDQRFVLGTDGVVYEVAVGEPLTVSETRTGATALFGGMTTVGNGIAHTPRYWDCH